MKGKQGQPEKYVQKIITFPVADAGCPKHTRGGLNCTEVVNHQKPGIGRYVLCEIIFMRKIFFLLCMELSVDVTKSI